MHLIIDDGSQVESSENSIRQIWEDLTGGRFLPFFRSVQIVRGPILQKRSPLTVFTRRDMFPPCKKLHEAGRIQPGE